MRRSRLATVTKWSAIVLSAGLVAYLLFVGLVGEWSSQWQDDEEQTVYTPKPDALPGALVFGGVVWAIGSGRSWWAVGLASGGILFVGAYLLSFGGPAIPFAGLNILLIATHAILFRRKPEGGKKAP